MSLTVSNVASSMFNQPSTVVASTDETNGKENYPNVLPRASKARKRTTRDHDSSNFLVSKRRPLQLKNR